MTKSTGHCTSLLAQRHDHHVSNAAVERKSSHQRTGLADIFVRGVVAVADGFLLFVVCSLLICHLRLVPLQLELLQLYL
ncbi:Uncharacterised protein [Klebsiella pneumoniae]|nr:Uncharacterised protein [Klebsiella pneumoniae]